MVPIFQPGRPLPFEAPAGGGLAGETGWVGASDGSCIGDGKMSVYGAGGGTTSVYGADG